MNKKPLSFVELSAANLIYNTKQFKNLANIGTKFSVAIKGNAYGHGQNEVAKILEPYMDYFQVDDLEELESLRQVSKKKTLVLGYVQLADLPQAIKLGCILSIFSIKELKEVNAISKELKIKQEIHIPVDAYLGREGFLLGDLGGFLKEVRRCRYIKATGIYAHFANMEDISNFIHARKQIREYNKALKLAAALGFKKLQTHISATSGILAYENCLPVGMKKKGINPLVRLGIGIYGLWPSKHLKFIYKDSQFKLKPVLAWKTRVAQVKILPKGFTVGYGLTYVTKKRMKVAVIPQGYADGIDRGLSNRGQVLIGGTRCKIIGRVSMNKFTADVSHLSNVKAEDEVVIIGTQHRKQITAEEIARKLNTINYEIVTRISSLLPRVVV
ncbi:alanine racemase [Candidatus Nomurabacteria bacterium RIFCSPLOWO2_02_FULL_40_10]|uniref:Alanine racemase n=2 Tax=Candidatus Nomuraibacteriota TaxID=1752729 RepID=A0A1F6Y0Q1_9BACT|nr:MAG: alanine racemase [Candidatus Nomurabacteria bacterium RIFCSPHIGHO2_01_FULL_39_10]OGI99933.1 MAG: alanine racemase [Candidatus Nomurabacteria bacterium RIFCSPLOWO2_02_FULL_40_10]